MEEVRMSSLEEVLKILGKLKPHFKMTRHLESGSGLVSESYFTFSHSENYYWIVILCGTGTFAFKEITPEWIKFYSNLILQSPKVYVEWDINHYITDWAVGQYKVCEEETEKKLVRAV